MCDMRQSSKLIPILLAAVMGTGSVPAAAQQDLPAWVERGARGPAHEQLDALEGTWRVEKSLYVALGTRDDPTISRDLICRREWLANGRFLRDVTEGTIAGTPYWRLGILGYSTMDERYEWVTIDAGNANMMIYRGEPGSGQALPITMSGVFTDQGMLGEKTVGEPIAQRIVIQIVDDDRHIIDLYFTAPDGEEFLADRSVYTRVQR